MQKLFTAFPAGWPGIGLICLRVAVATGVITQSVTALSAPGGPVPLVWAMGSLAILAGTALLIGFLTPLASVAATAGYLAMGISQWLGKEHDSHAPTAWYLAVISFALVLLGPGAMSLDARLFGRREIIIPSPSR